MKNKGVFLFSEESVRIDAVIYAAVLSIWIIEKKRHICKPVYAS